VEIIDNRSEV